MDRVKFHHASPLLRVTLCRRGECKPDIHNTVLFAIIHIKYHPLVSILNFFFLLDDFLTFFLQFSIF